MFYPRCATTFLNFLKCREPYLDAFFKLGLPCAWDCTLNDGLQSLPLEEQSQFKLLDKSKILFENIGKHQPYAVDLGSLTDPKLLPVMKHNLRFFKKTQNDYMKIELRKPHGYIQIFNTMQLDHLINQDMFHFISMSASLSEEFQHHNTRMSRESQCNTIKKIVKELDSFCYNREVITMPYPKVKLTLSCFNICPFEGKIDDQLIIDTVSTYYHTVKPDTLVLKDVTGLLTANDMERILTRCFDNHVSPTRVSMHFHELNHDGYGETHVSNLINKALDMKVHIFEVSSIKTGGCPHKQTTKIPYNVTYELFYKTIVDRILQDVQK